MTVGSLTSETRLLSLDLWHSPHGSRLTSSGCTRQPGSASDFFIVGSAAHRRRPEYRSHQGVDFLDRFIELKGEPHQVHTFEVAVLGQKDGPRWISNQIHHVPLIVSVAQAAHAAEKVAQMHQ